MLWLLALIPAIVLVWVIWAFNRLIAQRNTVAEAWSGVDVQLLRRYDLVPNLVETVKGYRSHELETLQEVTRLREQGSSSADIRGDEESRLSRQLVKLFALAEDYPELKADSNFRQLHQSLVEIENDLQFARRYYNGSVRDMNNLVQSFPSLLIAKSFGFPPQPFFELEFASQGKAPEVKL